MSNQEDLGGDVAEVTADAPVTLPLDEVEHVEHIGTGGTVLDYSWHPVEYFRNS